MWYCVRACVCVCVWLAWDVSSGKGRKGGGRKGGGGRGGGVSTLYWGVKK